MPTTRYDDTIIDELIWQAIRNSGCPADFRDYLDHRPENAMHLDEALVRLVELDDADATDADSPRGYPAAVAAIEALANFGDATAQFHMGKLLDKGIGVPPDTGRSVAWYRLAILQGELRSHINLAGTLLTGNATPADCAEARELYAKAAERGEPMGIFLLARMMAGGTHEDGAQPDPTQAFAMFHQAWAAGDSAAGHWIGHLLAIGKGVRRDETLGREWIVKAAEAGCIGAIIQLGREAESGRTASADGADAATWYRRGAEMGDIECQCRLGRALLTGEGADKDGAQAVYWLKRAAVRGSAFAQRLLGLAYLWGVDVVKNSRFGRRWLLRAATAGDADAGYQLGRLMQEGEDANPAEAAQWFDVGGKLACRQHRQRLVGAFLEDIRHWRKAAVQRRPRGLHLRIGKASRAGVAYRSKADGHVKFAVSPPPTLVPA